MTIKSLTDERNKIRKQKNFYVCVSLLDKLFHIKLEFCVEVFGCIWIMATCIFVIEMLRFVFILFKTAESLKLIIMHYKHIPQSRSKKYLFMPLFAEFLFLYKSMH